MKHLLNLALDWSRGEFLVNFSTLSIEMKICWTWKLLRKFSFSLIIQCLAYIKIFNVIMLISYQLMDRPKIWNLNCRKCVNSYLSFKILVFEIHWICNKIFLNKYRVWLSLSYRAVLSCSNFDHFSILFK